MTVNTFDNVVLKVDKVHYSPIIWSMDTIENGKVKKNALYLPIKIEGIDQQLKMQLDLGANSSLLYLKTIRLLGEKNPEILKSIDLQKDRYSYLKTNIIINEGIQLHSAKTPMLKNFGQDTLLPDFPVVGTLGFDIIGKNILIIDFVNDSIAIVEKLPTEMENMTTFIKKADLKNFPVILPFTIGDKNVRLFYDSGSSSFEILTGTRRLKKISMNRELEVIDSVFSWGEKIYVYKAKTPKLKENLYLGPYDLGEVNIVGTDKLNPLSLIGKYLYGITGNEIFKNSIIIIDRKNNRFGMIKQYASH